jgi:hypothetical protein
MGPKQDVQEILDAQKQSILNQLKLDNRKKYSILNEKIANLEKSFNVQMEELKAHAQSTPSENPDEPTTVDNDVMDVSSAESDLDNGPVNPKAEAYANGKIYDIMCLVFEKDVCESDFEKDDRFNKIYKKVNNDEIYMKNDYNVHNRNLSLIRDLYKRFQIQYEYHKNNAISFQDPV